MRFRRPKFTQRQHPDVSPGLMRLYTDPELAPARSFISDMLMYSEVGRDRHTLGPEYVAFVEKRAREHIERTEQLRRSLGLQP